MEGSVDSDARQASMTTDPVQVLVLADTHLRRDWPGRRLPDQVREMAAAADVILHAGDVLQQEHLDDLGRWAAVHVVRGNNDVELTDVPERVEVELAGVRIGMVHDSGRRTGRAERLHRMFPSADVVVFGHSHAPCNEAGVDGQLLFNPGSPTERRRQPHRTVGVLQLVAGEVRAARIEIIDH